MLKRIILLFLLTGFFSFTNKDEPVPQPKAALKTIIIDPGHGGIDPGARGQLATEADIALSISLRLGKLLKEELPDVNVIFTRTKDELAGVPDDKNESLRYRARMANEARGDLFVSIHCNAAGVRAGGWYTTKTVGYKNKKPIRKRVYVKNAQHGTETFIWAADRAGFKSEAVNEAEEGGEEVVDSNNVLDMQGPEAIIRSQLYAKKYFDKSLMLATFVEDEFVKGGRTSRGVKQRNEKGIWVLQATGMPSVLVETGFVSNTEEEKYLISDKGQDEIAHQILHAIERYKEHLESTGTH